MVRWLYDEKYVEAAHEALKRPDCFLYYGDTDLFGSWGLLPFGQHRDSGSLDRSNYRTILADLQGTAVHDDPDGDGAENSTEFVDDFRSSHWLVGWSEQIMCRVLIDPNGLIEIDNLTRTFCRSVEIQHALADYPIFDESDWSELEYTECMEAFESTWSGMFWEEVSPNHADENMKYDVWRKLTECAYPEGFSDEEIAEAVLAWTWDFAWADYHATYADQLVLF
ncbi:hypothetical protein D5S17_09330 [Pseudonocardiaceae bacterium YIM PH 21723]|nr:hypothetical protein D5S17_09330 [Pseudonocardiaceae bacterium YIM PH 21723]